MYMFYLKKITRLEQNSTNKCIHYSLFLKDSVGTSAEMLSEVMI